MACGFKQGWDSLASLRGALATKQSSLLAAFCPCAVARPGTCFCHIPWRRRMSNQRRVRLFRNDRNQAVRIPVEFKLPGDEAIMHRDGDRLVIEPVRKRGLVALLKTMKPLEEQLPEIDDPVPARENPF